MLSEEEVYLGCKNFLLQSGFLVLAGQPPRGVDHLPVIEIKEADRKGSLSVYKPDLIAFRAGKFYLIECKPAYSAADRAKLNAVLGSENRKRKLFTELEQYRLMEKASFEGGFDAFCASLLGVLAYAGEHHPTPELYRIRVFDWRGNAELIAP